MATVTWQGMEQLLTALRELPAHLVDEAGNIVDDAAELAFASMYQAYPRRSGNLRKGLKKTTVEVGQFGVAIRIENKAPHAWLFEHGSVARHYVTKRGREHRTGQMWGKRAPTPVLIPTAVRERLKMVQRLVDMVRGEGFTVTGTYAP